MRLLIFPIIFLFTMSPAFSQLLETEIELSYKSNADKTSTLSASLEDEDGLVPENSTIVFKLIGDSLETELGRVIADEGGNAVLKLDKPGELFTLHQAEFRAEYAGSDEHEGSNADIMIREAEFSMKAEIIDSVYTVLFQLNSWDEEGELTGVEDGEIYVYVPRLFGQLKVGEAWTDDEGQDQTKIPYDIPGDEQGVITLISRIDEHEEFGTLEISQEIDWGVPLSEINAESRELWTDKPPLWMVITFVVLMVAVWSHYLIIFLNLRKIREDEGDSGILWNN